MSNYKEPANVQTEGTENDNRTAIDMIREAAAKKIEQIGLVGAEDIISAFSDKDDKGRLLTCVEMRESMWSAEQGRSVKESSMTTTMDALIKLELAGGYTMLILQFPDSRSADLSRMWAALEEYGTESAKLPEDAAEIPVVTIAAVPMSLGGKYGMIAPDPVFWCLQPSSPVVNGCDQIRLLFQPEAVMFIRDDSFDSEEVIAKVKSELAAEKLTEEGAARKAEEALRYKAEKEAELQQFIESNHGEKHTFTTTKDPGRR